MKKGKKYKETVGHYEIHYKYDSHLETTAHNRLWQVIWTTFKLGLINVISP